MLVFNIVVSLGDRQCMICGGECCPLVNSVMDALLEEGDLNPNEVVYYILYIFMPFIFVQNQRQAVIAMIHRLNNLKIVASKVGKQVFLC